MVKFTELEDNYIVRNYTSMTSSKIAKGIGKELKQVENRVRFLKKCGLIYNKSNYAPLVDTTKLEMQGIQNKMDMTEARKKIKLNKFIKLQINNCTENCEVIFKTFNYFTVKHKNYIESFNYSDVLMGVVSFGR